MIAFANPISEFVSRNPSMKMLALALLVAIGLLLVAESFHHKIPKGYLYFAMAFAFGVEMLNIQVDKKRRSKRLKQDEAAS
jgi:predicted tellurium resistance membrane protein TerC